MGKLKDVVGQLRQLKELLDEHLISQSEYEDLRQRVLSEEFGSPIQEKSKLTNGVDEITNSVNTNNNSNNTNKATNNNENYTNSTTNNSGYNSNNNNNNAANTNSAKEAVKSNIANNAKTSTPKVTIHNVSPFVPRQFEYNPTITEYMVFGSVQGDVVVLNQFNSHRICAANSKKQTQILGLCWLHKEPMKFVAGAHNGVIALVDVNKSEFSMQSLSVIDLTSIHINCIDTLCAVSGYAHDVVVFDVERSTQTQVLKEAHGEHINVIKFSHHDPNLMATCSLDKTVKLWDLRTRPFKPIYTRASKSGNITVTFSPDDKYLLVGAGDNEVRQYTIDGKLHTNFYVPKLDLFASYTRAYYMNNGEYIIVGSSEGDTVWIYEAGTGELFREVKVGTLVKEHNSYIQSLRGDPLRPFNFTVILTDFAKATSRLVSVSLLDS